MEPEGIEERNAFRPGRGKKLIPARTDGRQRRAMVDPYYQEGRAEEKLELQAPRGPLRRQQKGVKIAQMLEMKCDVLHFVRQNPQANLIQNRVARPPCQHPVVSGSDQFRD